MEGFRLLEMEGGMGRARALVGGGVGGWRVSGGGCGGGGGVGRFVVR